MEYIDLVKETLFLHQGIYIPLGWVTNSAAPSILLGFDISLTANLRYL